MTPAMVEQHEAQIFLTRGFDDSVLRVKGVGAKPAQKLRKHSELVQPGGRIHDRVYMCVFTCVLASHSGPLAQDFDHLPRQSLEGVGVKLV